MQFLVDLERLYYAQEVNDMEVIAERTQSDIASEVWAKIVFAMGHTKQLAQMGLTEEQHAKVNEVIGYLNDAKRAIGLIEH